MQFQTSETSLLRLSRFPLSPSLSPSQNPRSPISHSQIPKSPLSHTLSPKSPFQYPKNPILASPTSSSSSSSSPSILQNFGGWDDLESPQDPDRSREFDRFRHFLISVGIDERKHLFLFLAGFASALAISRVRFYSILVLPASVVVFVVGFLSGIVRGGGVVGNGNIGFLERDNLRKLEGFLSELDVKLSELMIRLESVIKSNKVEIGEITGVYEVVESVKLGVKPAIEAFEASLSVENRILGTNEGMDVVHNVRNSSDEMVEDQQVEKGSKNKSGRRKKEMILNGFDFVRFLSGGVFTENMIGLKSRKANVAFKQETKEQFNTTGESNQAVLDNHIEKEGLNPTPNVNLGNAKMGSSLKVALDDENFDRNSKRDSVSLDGSVISSDDSVRSGFKAGKSIVMPQDESENSYKMEPSNEHISGNKTSSINGCESDQFRFLSYKDDTLSFENGRNARINGLQFTNDKAKINSVGSQSQGGVSDPASCDAGEEDSFRVETGAYNRGVKQELRQSIKVEKESVLNAHRYMSDMELDRTPCSSENLGDEEFNIHLKEASGLLKQARECLMVQEDDEGAEVFLLKCANELSTALQIKPMNLRAVGQLGNTLLLHGELKLKKCRELRALLSRSGYLSYKRESRLRPDKSDYQATSKDKIRMALVDICEECEELLVEAGRKYRMALSIDSNDVRALYNWGLALTFRAQLIADVGPEAALDADKVFLAAIDKFDAMASKNSSYAPEALFRWGVALQLRSQLRPSNSSEKLKLLRQAKSLLEDAFNMDSENPQVREALSSCIYEINSRQP